MANPAGNADELASVLADVSRGRGCQVLPPEGLPAPSAGLVLPDDLRDFYDACGGLVLFSGAPFEWRVSGPSQLVAASQRLLGPNVAQQVVTEQPEDLTNGCFVFAECGVTGGANWLIVVDLHPARAGRYYDAFWDSYGLVGQMPILALTAAEMIRRLLETEGERPVHDGPDHGDAYDDNE